jgi:hypothetical protein
MTKDITKQQWNKRKKEKSQGILDRNISQADSIMPMTKESHSSWCTTFTTRLDTLSSRIDIRFIKPQALLALSIVICAWRLAKVKRFLKSEILEEYSAHWQQRRGGDKTLESKAPAEVGAWS